MDKDVTRTFLKSNQEDHDGWLQKLVQSLQRRLRPSTGRRPGRPTDETWVLHPKVPMSVDTGDKLKLIAKLASQDRRQVSPMHIAAQLLEDALDTFPKKRKS